MYTIFDHEPYLQGYLLMIFFKDMGQRNHVHTVVTFFPTWYSYLPLRECVSCMATFDPDRYFLGHLLMTR